MPADPALDPGTPKAGAVRWTRRVLGVAALALCVAVLWRVWPDIRDSLRALRVSALLAAWLLAVVAMVLFAEQWRTVLRSLGTDLPRLAAYRVFFLGQLGKYLPGSVWQVAAQAELARDHGAPASRSAVAAVLSPMLSVLVAVALGAVALPFGLAGSASTVRWLAAAALPVLVLCHPAVLARILAVASRRLRLPALDRSPSHRDLAVSLAWTLAGWLLLGVHVAVLVEGLGVAWADALPISIGLFPLAWSAGFLAVLAPAGAAVREGVLIAGLAAVLPSSEALAVALLSRFALAFVDLLLALVAALAWRRATPRSARARRG